jgi:trimeric autotransporter adhesin
VYGSSYGGYGCTGVYGYSDSSYGMYGASSSGVGVYGYSNSGYAAYLDGRVYIRGPLSKPGGSFKIDHPLDPANKYLSHSFVESPDMKNVYDGVVVLDDNGEAVIDLPDWFVHSIRIFAISLLLLELLDQICILQRKYLRLQLQTTVVTAAITITVVTSRLQEVLQV